MAALGIVFMLCLEGAAAAEGSGPAVKLALDPSLAAYAPSSQVAGELRIAGSTTMQPLTNRLAGEFRRYHPNVRVTIEAGGSASVLKELLGENGSSRPKADKGQENARPTLLAAVSRLLTDAERQQFVSRHGHEPSAIPVAMDAVGIYVHRDNPLPNLTLEQVDALFSSTRNRGYPFEIGQWGQLGLQDEWVKAPVRLYGRGEKSGTRDFVKEHALRSGEFKPEVHEEPGAASVILALSRDPFGIGYSGIGLQASTVRALPLAEKDGMPFVSPDMSSVMDGSYPLHRLLYLYVDKSPTAGLSPAVREFLAFVNSREGQEAVIKGGAYPLPRKEVEQSLALLALPGAS